MVKKAEHFWKGLSNNKSQISPIPPEAYGDRFIHFMSGITMTKEEAEREKESADIVGGSAELHRGRDGLPRSSTDRVMEKAEKQAAKTERHGAREDSSQDRTLSTTRRQSGEMVHGVGGQTLPVLEEVGEAGSTGGRSGHSGNGDIIQPTVIESSSTSKGKGRANSRGRDKELPPIPLSLSPPALEPENSIVRD